MKKRKWLRIGLVGLCIVLLGIGALFYTSADKSEGSRWIKQDGEKAADISEENAVLSEKEEVTENGSNGLGEGRESKEKEEDSVRKGEESKTESSEPKEKSVGEESSGPGYIYVHVGGAVAYPDRVYRMKEGSRVSQVIKEAGGLSEDADLRWINLACGLCDGDKIYIPFLSENLSEEETQKRQLTSDNANKEGGVKNQEKTKENTQNLLTNLNSADTIELQNLPGIGPALAKRILEYRAEIIRFSSKEQLKNVSGIGDKLFAQISPLVTVE